MNILDQEIDYIDYEVDFQDDFQDDNSTAKHEKHEKLFYNNHTKPFSNNYKDETDKKYTLATDFTNTGIKKYYGVNTFLQLEILLKNNLKNKNKVYYEIIKNTCKFYFDFDKIKITREQLDFSLKD